MFCRNLAAYVVLLPLGKHISIHTQIVLPLATAAVVVILQAWIAVDTSISGMWVIIATLASTAVLGAATAPLTSASYALASYLPSKYIQVCHFPMGVAERNLEHQSSMHSFYTDFQASQLNTFQLPDWNGSSFGVQVSITTSHCYRLCNSNR